jgi:hypothetical protein
MVMSPVELGPENDCAGEGPAAIVTYKPIPSSERILHKEYDRKCTVEEKITGRESQGACRKDELIRKVTVILTLI